nr:unnamed protein product [Digitaria exilis]
MVDICPLSPGAASGGGGEPTSWCRSGRWHAHCCDYPSLCTSRQPATCVQGELYGGFNRIEGSKLIKVVLGTSKND